MKRPVRPSRNTARKAARKTSAGKTSNDELAIVERLKVLARGTRPAGSGIVLGIGDDCAIFRPRPGEDLLFTTDQMIEGVHFEAGQDPAITGQRALARNLSDIAAMGGEPRFCLVTLALPARGRVKWIEAFYRGLLGLARRTGTELAGGDLSHDDKVRCDVMVCGAVARGKALRRDGARPGNGLYVSGRLGRHQWDRPIQPRLALGQSLIGRATACIDISDGLSLDLHRLCLASGVAAEVERVPIARGATHNNVRLDDARLDDALHGGEDYELLFTLPPGVPAPRGTTRIGAIVRGTPGAVMFQGRPLPPRGYDHFNLTREAKATQGTSVRASARK